MDNLTFKFKVISFNVRGLNEQRKRRSIFKWLKQKRVDVCLLQETYCTSKVQNIWKNEWGGKVMVSNGTNHARGVAVLLRAGFDAEIIDVIKDDSGRMLLLKLKIQDTYFTIVNIYAPNTEASQFHFYHFIRRILNKYTKPEENILLGGGLEYYY